MKSWTKPTAEQVARAVSRLAHQSHYRYFFAKLTNPEWIEPLRARGFFKNPPSPFEDDKGTLVGWPQWPESRYLAEMAPLAPDAVLEILLDLPRTANPFVHRDVLEATCALPPAHAARLSDRLLELTAQSGDGLVARQFADLIAHLAKGGQIPAAVRLLKSVFAPQPGKRDRGSDVAEFGSLSPEPISRFETWAYEDGVLRASRAVTEATGLDGLEAVVTMLSDAIRLYVGDPAQEGYRERLSIRRPTIESTAQHYHHGVADALVTAVRDCALLCVSSGQAPVGTVVELLQRQAFQIFTRIALHVLRVHPERGLVAATLLSVELLSKPGLAHEASLLFRDGFPLLMPSERESVLALIRQGPNLESFRRRFSEREGRQPTKEEEDTTRQLWTVEKLGWIRDNLGGEWRSLFQELVAHVGEPRPPGSGAYDEVVWVGPTAPLTEDAIGRMTIPDLVGYLRNWRWSAEPGSPTPEGLGRSLTTVVAADPARYASEAHHFEGLDPTYVRALFEGLRDATRARKDFEWPPILMLARWAVAQPREIERRQSVDWDIDPHWGPCRKAIADLISVGLSGLGPVVPYGQREEVWAILEQLMQDPDPGPDDERKADDASRLDPATLAINSIRGEALEAACQYGLWVRRHQESESGTEGQEGGFAAMPEVRCLLDWHLDVANDPSRAVRSVYGRFLPWLHLLDPKWVQASIGTILPMADSMRPWWDAAWKTYLVFCRPYDALLPLLADHYRFAVGVMLKSDERSLLPGDPLEHLAAHLMAYFIRGRLDSEEGAGLLGHFWSSGSPCLRGLAIAYLGRSMHHREFVADASTLERLRRLWEVRLAVARLSLVLDAFHDELAAFGWWFSSARLEDEWSLVNMRAVLELKVAPDADARVMARLAQLSPAWPRLVMECIDRLVCLGDDPWDVYKWKDSLHVALAEGLRAADPVARQIAGKTIDHLGRRGYL